MDRDATWAPETEPRLQTDQQPFISGMDERLRWALRARLQGLLPWGCRSHPDWPLSDLPFSTVQAILSTTCIVHVCRGGRVSLSLPHSLMSHP